jgi:kynureninase
MNSLETAKALDLDDSLSQFKNRFFHPDNELYFDGNSLGKMPLAAQNQLVSSIQKEWGQGLIRSWNTHWLELPKRLSTKYSQLLGSHTNEIIIGESTSVRLYEVVHALLESKKFGPSLISDSLNFPTDLYILDGLARSFKEIHRIQVDYKNEIEADLNQLKLTIKENPGIVCLSLVSYKSAFLYPMKMLNKWAMDHQSIIVWDLSHAVGAVSIDLKATQTRVALGCTYKYMNGGPGAPAFLYVQETLCSKLNNPIQGWFGHQKPFDFTTDYHPASTINRFAAGTPAVLSMRAMEAGIDTTLEAGIEAIHSKSIQLTESFIRLFETHLIPLDFKLESPTNPTHRGSHVTLSHPASWQVCQTLLAGSPTDPKMIPDFRPPNYIRFGFTPLYTSFEDIWHLVQRLKTLTDSKDYLKFNQSKPTVT